MRMEKAMFEFRGKVRSYGDMQRMFADPQALHPLLSSLQVGKSAKINGDRITRLPDSDAEQQSTIAAQAAEIKLLRDALDQIKMDAEGALARREGVNANTTLHTIKNALKPQESEAQHG